MTGDVFLAVGLSVAFLAVGLVKGLQHISESMRQRRRARQFNEQINWRNQ